jgi:uncharacterized membrane protein
VRAFLPFAFLALFSAVDFFSAPALGGTSFAFLDKTWVVAVLFVLAVVEIVIDAAPLLPSRDIVLRPVRILVGAVAFAAVVAPHGWIVMVICAIAGLAIAYAAEYVGGAMRPDAKAGTMSLAFTSIYWDVAVLVGVVLFVLVPVLGALFAISIFLLVLRLRQRRMRKHKGLRILKG